MIGNSIIKKHILFVDDYEGSRMVIGAMLKNYDVDSAANGPEAIEFMRKKHYDLVITDMEIPGMTGIDLLRMVKAVAPDTRVIITSSNGTINSYMDSMALGASEYLNKPLELKRFTKTVANVFSQYPQPRLAA